MATISIGGINYGSYSTLAEADIYYAGSSEFAAWSAFSNSEKERGLISATRLIDRQSWLGAKEDSSQTLAFPRTGLTDCAGSEVSADESLVKATEGAQLLALDILSGSTVATSTTNESTTKRLKADTVEIEYFRLDKSQSARFDADVMEVLGCFLSSSSTLAGSMSYGTDGEALDNDFSVNLGA
jgi:hypothetical protein